MAAPTLARAGRRKQKSYLLFKRTDSSARTKKKIARRKNEGKMGRTGNYNLHLEEYFKALEKVDFRDCLDLK